MTQKEQPQCQAFSHVIDGLRCELEAHHLAAHRHGVHSWYALAEQPQTREGGERELIAKWRNIANFLDKPRQDEREAEERYPRIALTRGAIHLHECADELEAALRAAGQQEQLPAKCFNCEAQEGLRLVSLCTDCLKELEETR